MLRLLVGVLACIALMLAASGARAERSGTAVLGASPAVLAATLLAQADLSQSAPSQPTPYTPPRRGAPDGRTGGASRDIGPAERRLALVVGNDRYQNVPVLSKAATDASAVCLDAAQARFRGHNRREPITPGVERSLAGLR